jgi:hypothetical protein
MVGAGVIRFEFKLILVVVLIVIEFPLVAMVEGEDCAARTISGRMGNEGRNVVDDVGISLGAGRTKARLDEARRFALAGSVPSYGSRLTARRRRYHVTGTDVQPLVKSTQSSCATSGDRDYAWIPPAIEDRSPPEEFLIQTVLSLAAHISFDRLFLPLASGLTLGCRDCHREVFDQWAAGAHALGARNVRFLTMYNGTDVDGNQSPRTRHNYRGSCRFIEDYGLIGQYVGDRLSSRETQGRRRDYGVPLRPDPDLPYCGPGYKLDFPQTEGNCAACHLPSAALADPYGADPNQALGVGAQGTHCDFCHKIAAVKLDPVNGLPRENMPGVLSIEFARPGPESQLFFRPCDDVDVGPVTCLPPMKDSKACAPCHQASFWGIPIYESFAEWLASPYPVEGKTCQSCHMTPNAVMTNFAPGRGGVERDPVIVPTHDFPGAMDQALLQNALTMAVSASHQDGQVGVGVTVTNDKTGHHVPTGSPLRHLILLVEAYGADGNFLSQLDGPVLPEWCGVGETAHGCYAGLPGKVYAKVLQEWWTEVAPTGAYWSKTRLLSDNRIAAFAADTSLFTFNAANYEEVTVNVKLLYRRAFVSLMKQKGWDDPDIVMGQESLTVRQPHSLCASREEDSR